LITLVIGVQIFLYFSIAALLIKDTLMAVVVAAFGLFAFPLLVAITNISSSQSGRGYNLSHENAVLLAYLASFVVGSILLVVTYRWRWGAGQYAPISMFAGTTQSS